MPLRLTKMERRAVTLLAALLVLGVLGLVLL